MAQNNSRIQAFKEEMKAVFEKYQVEMEIETSYYVEGIMFYMGGDKDSTGEFIPCEEFKIYGSTLLPSDFK